MAYAKYKACVDTALSSVLVYRVSLTSNLCIVQSYSSNTAATILWITRTVKVCTIVSNSVVCFS
jgi:hypothetical protein